MAEGAPSSPGQRLGPTGPAALVELLNLPDGLEAPWRRWIDRTYLPARAALAGVIAARRAVGVVGSVRELVLYDLVDRSVASSPAWEEVGARLQAGEAASAELRVYRERANVVLYRQISGSVDSAYLPPEAEIIHGAFFEVPPEYHDEFNDWYELEHLPSVLRVPGYLNGRRYQGVDDDCKFLALYDVASLEVAEGEVAYVANQSPWSDRIRAKVASARERRLFRVERLERGAGGEA